MKQMKQLVNSKKFITLRTFYSSRFMIVLIVDFLDLLFDSFFWWTLTIDRYEGSNGNKQNKHKGFKSATANHLYTLMYISNDIFRSKTHAKMRWSYSMTKDMFMALQFNTTQKSEFDKENLNEAIKHHPQG